MKFGEFWFLQEARNLSISLCPSPSLIALFQVLSLCKLEYIEQIDTYIYEQSVCVCICVLLLLIISDSKLLYTQQSLSRKLILGFRSDCLKSECL